MRFIAAILAGASLLISVGIATGAAQAADKIRLAAFRGNLTPPAILADETGAFAAEGIEIEFVPFDNSAVAATAVISGDVDIAAMAFTAAAYNLAGKGGLRAIAGTLREMPGYPFTAFVVSSSAWNEGVRSPGALIGRKIGITTVGSPLHFFVAELAERAGKDPRQLDLVQLRSMPATMAALQTGKVDGALLLSAMARRAESEGFGRIVGWVGEETPGQTNGLFASAATIAGKRALLERFLRAYRVGASLYFDAFLRRGADGSLIKGDGYERFLEILARRNGTNVQAMEANIGFNHPQAKLDVDSVMRQIALARRLGLVDQAFVAGDIFDTALTAGD